MERIGERVAARRARAVPAFFAPAGVGEVARAGMVDGFGTVAREIEGRSRDAAERFLVDVGEWRQLIERHKITGKPVASTERPKGLAELMRQRDEIEQREEQIVLSAERGDGLELDSRPDASPALVVCTVLDDAAAA